MKEPRILLSDFVFSGIMIMLLVISILSYDRINSLNNASNLVIHTIRVIQKLNEVLISMVDAETGQRGFLLTHDSAFLQPYYGALENTSLGLAQVDSLTSDNPAQHLHLEKLRTFINEGLAKLNFGLTLSSNDINA